MTIAQLQAAAAAAKPAAGDTSAASQLAYVTALQNLADAVNAGNDSSSPDYNTYHDDPDLGTATTALPATMAQLDDAQSALLTAQQAIIASQGTTIASQQATLAADDALLAYSSQAANATTKNYQITVPNFKEVPAPLGVTIPTKTVDAAGAPTNIATFTGNSFLRLGSSPTAAEWNTTPFQNSAKLARLVGDPSSVEGVEGITVGAAGTITSTNYDDRNASTLAPAGSLDFAEAFADGSGVSTDAYGTNQDPNFLLGFADDVRNRGPLDTTQCPATTNVNGSSVPNNNQNRQAETLRLLGKGGWWDHSDGNRITTTSGDKIEVIQGNYKLVVLGRQTVPDPPATGATKATIKSTYSTLINNAFITDVSGGHFQEQYPSPTPCIKTIEYVRNDAGEWTLYQDNGIGNLVTKLKGRTVDLFQGESREAYVGSNAASHDGSGTNGMLLDPVLVAKTWAKSSYSQTGSQDKPVGYDKPIAPATTPSGWPATPVAAMPGDVNAAVLQGDVVSATWAQRIRSYTGSSGKYVPYVYSATFADQIQSDTTTSGDNTSYTTAGGTISGTTKGKAVSSSTESTGGDITSTTTSSDNIKSTTVALNIANMVAGIKAVENLTWGSVGVVNLTGAGGSVVNMSLGSILGVLNINAGIGPIINMNATAAGVLNYDMALRVHHIGPGTSEHINLKAAFTALGVFLGVG
jgi:hypothetical protein